MPKGYKDYRHSFWSTGSLIAQYLCLFLAVFALLRFIGLGWLGGLIGGLIAAAALFALIYAVLQRRR